MKKIILSLSLALLSLTACAPQDREVVSKEKRDEILSQRSGGRSDGTEVQLGTYGLGAFMVEKQSEILQLLILSSANSGETRGGYTLHEDASRNGEVRHLNLDAEATPIYYKGFETKQKAAWDFLVETLPGQVSYDGSVKDSKLEFQNGLTGKALQAAIFEEYVGKISAVPLNDGSGLHQISYKSMGFLTLTKAGLTNTTLFTLNIDFRSDLSNLQSPTIRVLNSVAKINVARKRPMIVDQGSAAGELNFVNDPLCPRMLGVALIDPAKTKKELVFAEDKVAVTKTSYSAPNGDCGARPLVDLNRVLVY